MKLLGKRLTIIQDTREQAPLVFTHNYIKEVIIKKLDVGDYGAFFPNGELIPVIFERKSINDAYGTLSAGYLRFKEEMERAKAGNIKLIIIIEGALSKVLKGTKYSLRTPESIVFQLFTIWMRHGVQPIFCKDADECAEFITQFFIAYDKEYQNGLHKQEGTSTPS